MSFSVDVKEELTQIRNFTKKEELKAECIGYLISGNVTVNKFTARFATESLANVERFIILFKNLGVEDYVRKQSGKLYVAKFSKNLNISGFDFYYEKAMISQAYQKELQKKETLEKAIIRGVFLGSGSINNPESNYHLEVSVATQENAYFIESILRKYGIEPKTLEKRNKISLYVKDSECISKFLALIGATKAVLKFEDIRVIRNIKNNVNRKVNCETANLNKTVNSAIKQRENIKYLVKKEKFYKLPENLQEIAIARIKHPEASLVELGKLLKKPISKSGVNHRLKAIEKIVQEMKEGK